MKIIFICVIFLTSCGISSTNKIEITPSSPTPKKDLKLIIPNAGWEKIYFQGIDKASERDGLTKLRETILLDNDLEIRIWVGFGKYGFDGLILKRNLGEWSAISLKRMFCHVDEMGKTILPPPKLGWRNFLEKIVDVGILTLPDSSELNGENDVVDGKSYVVELNSNQLYRTYMYSDIQLQKWQEAKQMIKITETIADEFDLKSFSSKTGDCGE